MAKSIVKGGLAKRALVQLSYAIGVAKPLSLFVETYGSECDKHTPDSITSDVNMEFDARTQRMASNSLSGKTPRTSANTPPWTLRKSRQL